ncbi:MAG TPA: cupin domain-containing protein [Gaiellaceae bacterium]|nr:cupin domain-containing protein [Gaiellaceae bacterium]
MTAVNLFDVDLQTDEDDAPGYAVKYLRVGPLIGAEQLGLSVYELAPGNSICPYHYENAEEEWLIVLVGRPTLRTPHGERELGPWDCAFFPTGEEGAHKVTNRTDETVRVCIWSNRLAVATSVYPDSDKVGAWPPGKLFRLGDAVEYFTGEAAES